MESPDGIHRDGWIAAGVGAVLAAAVLPLPFLSFVVSYFGVLVHEMGHTLAGWLYGYPSIPAFDFVYGGGITSHTDRSVLLGAGVQIALLAAIWLFRRNPLSLGTAVVLNALYAATAWTSLHQPVITAMGHGSELVIAGTFLHRALSGRACHHAAERVAYAFLGFFLTFHNLRFAWRLVVSPYHRELYEGSKGGGHWMDFSVLAEQHLHTSLESVAGTFLALCLVPAVLAFLGNHHRAATAAAIVRLRQV